MQTAASALLYLRLTSIRNLLVARIKRLKQAKYLSGAIVGVVYFYWFFLRPFRLRVHLQPASVTTSANLFDHYHSAQITMGALVFTILILFYWLWPRTRAALTFSEAEIAFLFPAPIGRRTLIHYRLISLMFLTVFTALVFLVFSSRSGLLPGNAWIRFSGWWLVLITLGLHSIASSFVITRLFDRGVTSLRRQIMVLSGVVIIIAALGGWAWYAMPVASSADLQSTDSLKNYMINLLNAAPLSWLLFPAKLVIAPALTSNLQTYLFAMMPALLMLILHYYWVLRSEVSFEEASIVKAEKRAARVIAARAGKLRFGSSAPTVRKPPFNIGAIRRPDIAFLWKNLYATPSYLRLRTAIIAIVIVVLGSAWIMRGDHEVIRSMVMAISTIFMGYTLFLGPMLARQDLRNDLANVDVLKTYPLQGRQIVLGEVLTPVIILSCTFSILLLAASLCMQTEKIKWLTSFIHWAGTFGIAVIASLLCTIQVLVLNASAILFPSWTQLNKGGAAGIEVMGQRLLFIAGLMLIILFALLPAALFAALAFFLTKWFIGAVIAATLAVLVIIAILVVEIVYGLDWLGDKFEQFDLSAELST